MGKIKKLIAGILAISLMFLCSACMIANNDDGKRWMLVDETTYLVGENGEQLQNEIHYGYDSYGRINEQTYNTGSAYRNYYSDFKYDDNGNVIFCIRHDSSLIITECSYEYDSDKLIKLTEKNTKSTSETIYQYNDKGDKIYEEYNYKSSSYEYTEKIEYTTYYENDVLVYCEMSVTNTDSEGTKYLLSKFSYDKNDNKITEHKYIAEDYDDGRDTIEYNGKTYVIQYVKYFTYEQMEFEKLNEYSNPSNNDDSNYENSFEESTTEKTTPLSEWGFNNIDEWGGKLVEVQRAKDGNFVFNENDGKGYYVIIQEGTGFWEFYPSMNQMLTNSFYFDGVKSHSSGTFTVLDNDTASCVVHNDWSGALRIKERTVENDVVIFTTNDGGMDDYLMPYIFIDKEVEEVFFESGEYGDPKEFAYYKVYLDSDVIKK